MNKLRSVSWSIFLRKIKVYFYALNITKESLAVIDLRVSLPERKTQTRQFKIKLDYICSFADSVLFRFTKRFICEESVH